jgi:hypothetical protein
VSLALILAFFPRRRNRFHAFLFSGRPPANPAADISKDAGNVESPLPGRDGWVRASVKNHYWPVQKIFAPLRLCAFALKMTSAETSVVGRSSR